MKIKLLVHHRVYEGQGPNAPSKLLKDKVELDIPELADDDAPLAIEWTGGRTRWFGGRHYREWTGVDPVEMSAKGTAEEATDYLLRSLKGKAETPLTGYADIEKRSSAVGFMKAYHRADSPSRLEALRRVDQFQRDCVAVEGRFWVACPEPCYTLTAEGMGVAVYRVVDKVTKDGREYDVPRKLNLDTYAFRLDRPEDMAEFAAANRYPVLDENVVAHLPDSLLREDEMSALVGTARGYADGFSEKKLFEVEPGLARCLIDLHEALAEAAEAPNDGDRLCALLGRAAETDRARSARKLLTVAVNRWSDRPIRIDVELGTTKGFSG